MKILYSGGGTMGSVSPLIAIHQKLITDCRLPASSADSQITDYDSLWLGTQKGPEREVVEKAGIKFEVIESGKFRRYFDLKNLLDFFRIIIGFFQALYWCLKFEPDIVLTAGSFVSVPVAYAAFLYGARVFVHQQDVEVGLANKLIAPISKSITVALEKSLDDFKKEKVVLVGNPVRFACHSDRSGGISHANFIEEILRPRVLGARDDKKEKLPTVLILGGGTGALSINELVWQSLPELIKFCNIIHITGKNKLNSDYRLLAANLVGKQADYRLQYHSFEFLDEQQIYSAMQVANVVISRAGMSTLTELAYFKKPAIIIPIPDSHQEKNAEYFQAKNAAIYLSQKDLTQEKFIEIIKNSLANETQRKEIGENMNKIFIDYSGEKYLEEILK